MTRFQRTLQSELNYLGAFWIGFKDGYSSPWGLIVPTLQEHENVQVAYDLQDSYDQGMNLGERLGKFIKGIDG